MQPRGARPRSAEPKIKVLGGESRETPGGAPGRADRHPLPQQTAYGGGGGFSKTGQSRTTPRGRQHAQGWELPRAHPHLPCPEGRSSPGPGVSSPACGTTGAARPLFLAGPNSFPLLPPFAPAQRRGQLRADRLTGVGVPVAAPLLPPARRGRAARRQGIT